MEWDRVGFFGSYGEGISRLIRELLAYLDVDDLKDTSFKHNIYSPLSAVCINIRVLRFYHLSYLGTSSLECVWISSTASCL